MFFPIAYAIGSLSYLLFRLYPPAARFGRPVAPGTPPVRADVSGRARHLRTLLRLVDKYALWENRCRHQAFQARVLCRWWGVPYAVHVGMRRTETGAIDGHAWTVVNDEFITGFCEPESYTILNSYHG